MSAQTYMKQSLTFLHNGFKQAGEGLSSEQLHMVPEGESHSIAWIMWHGARVEDLIMQQIIKGEAAEWDRGGWASKTGLPEKGFGTGQSTEEAKMIRIPNVDAFLGYAAKVAELTDAFLDSASDADLEREVTVGQNKETVGQAINLHLTTHLNGHRGEINLLRGMMGFAPVMPNRGG